MSDPSRQSLDMIRLALMEISESFAPFHEFIDGEVAHFERQGFTAREARAMTAAEFVATFGLNIHKDS